MSKMSNLAIIDQQTKVRYNQFDINKSDPIPMQSSNTNPRLMPLVSDLIAMYGEDDIKELIKI